jgi:hypothetical protein
VHAYDEHASLRRDAVVSASWPVASGGEDPRINRVSLFHECWISIQPITETGGFLTFESDLIIQALD